jgi:PhnB protein
MSQVNTFLNFSRNTEEAFEFYKEVFNSDYLSDIVRIGETALQGDENLVAHVALPILGGHILNGADAPDSMGMHVTFGNNIYIILEPDTREETEKLFESLSQNGKIDTPLDEQPWGAYYGICTDKFGVQWVFSYLEK